MKNFSKYLNILTIAMFVVTLVLLGFFYFGGNVPNQALQTPIYTGQLLVWAYILLAICAAAAIIFPIIQLLSNPKTAIKALSSFVAIVVVVFVAYALSDGTILTNAQMPGYSGPDNVPDRLKLADTLLYTTYFLGIIAIGSIFVTELIRKFR